MSSEGVPSRSRSDELVAAIEVLVERAKGIYDSMRTVSFVEALQNVTSLAFRVSVLRQIEALEGSLALTRLDLGHLAVTFVRPAFEEYFWLKYISSLESEMRQELLLQLAGYEGSLAVLAQQRYAGKRDMKALGFPAAFVRETERNRIVGKTRLARLGNALGWPESEDSGSVAFPTAHWIANQIGEGKLYDFLYSASSRMVHFSANEVARRDWADAPTAQLDLASNSYTDYRTQFGLSWLARLLVSTLAIGADLPDEFGPREDVMAGYVEAVQRVAEFGQYPIVTAAEFNIRPTRRSRRAGSRKGNNER